MYLSIFIADSVTIDKPIGNPDVILTTTTAEQISVFVNGASKATMNIGRETQATPKSNDD